MALHGIDISKWQSKIDLTKIKFDFLIAKATEGGTYVDPYCNKFISFAKNSGKPFGFYHFARPTNSVEKEANHFYNTCNGYFGQGIPVLDWEAENISDVNWAKKWLDKIYELTGVRPLIYMSASVSNQYNWTSVSKNYGLWVAKYRDNTPDKNYNMNNAGVKPSSKYWPNLAMWQWTSVGRLDGYSGDLDCDIFYGDISTWNKYASATEKASSTHTNPVKPTSELLYTVVKGDTLSSIARKYNTAVANLAKINNISNVNKISIGQKLKV